MTERRESDPVDPRLEFTLEEFERLLKWAHEGLLTAAAGGPEDDALFRRLQEALGD